MNVKLSVGIQEYISDQIATGTYEDASEVIREALRLKMKYDELHEAKIDAISSVIEEEELAIAPEPFDLNAFINQLKNADE